MCQLYLLLHRWLSLRLRTLQHALHRVQLAAGGRRLRANLLLRDPADLELQLASASFLT